ncbi:MAG: hypothetical protein P8L38_05295 [Gammaproteobacteria bacterium]|jgi:hypothetical protein|nr:hypothetical protein [Gammaproteobacteria bacterium]|tara:strand:- start:818 stop:1138 length:321 start_codon:yes stop_codon:yes gene_type:complete
MIELNVILGENEYPLKIKEKIVTEAQSFFNQMDSDMDKGWQMSKSWVENPSQFQRCQIAADRLFTSIHLNKKETAIMMAAYIINQMPEVKVIDIDISGNMEETSFS